MCAVFFACCILRYFIDVNSITKKRDLFSFLDCYIRKKIAKRDVK